ncbi:hypothetical protein MNBD_GAMMA22-372 [hydrothermal vent metagenome]|uniref:Uncharacterized protein n=1 Tax=hydrothermal vent metagenome TaxID=652676 RepID=A0A3B1A8H0_9ZZZZ
MMKCDELQQRLDDYLDAELDAILVPMLEQHATSCESCSNLVNNAKLVKSGLKQLADKNSSMSDDFITKAFENVRQQYPEKASEPAVSKIGVKTSFVTAVAAGFALWAVLTTFILPDINSNNTVDVARINNTLNLIIDKTRVVRLAIDTPDEFDKVTLSVELPKHVELKGHKNKRKLSWDAKLAKGSNILRIPLKAISFGQGEFIARITHNGKVKTFKLFLQSKNPDLSHSNAIQLQV